MERTVFCAATGMFSTAEYCERALRPTVALTTLGMDSHAPLLSLRDLSFAVS